MNHFRMCFSLAVEPSTVELSYINMLSGLLDVNGKARRAFAKLPLEYS